VAKTEFGIIEDFDKTKDYSVLELRNGANYEKGHDESQHRLRKKSARLRAVSFFRLVSSDRKM